MAGKGMEVCRKMNPLFVTWSVWNTMFNVDYKVMGTLLCFEKGASQDMTGRMFLSYVMRKDTIVFFA